MDSISLVYIYSDLEKLYNDDPSLAASEKFSNFPIHTACRSKSVNNAKIVENLINWYAKYEGLKVWY